MLPRYFAYGSNMNAARVRQRGLQVIGRRGATLANCRLVFDKMAGNQPGVGHANLVRAPGEVVEGVLYDLAHVTEILKMDPFEQAPVNYTREAVAVAVGAEVVWAWTYYANSARRARNLRPSQNYLDHLLAGSELLSESYSEALRSVECVP